MTTFDRIKNISKKRGLSLQDVAEKAGMSRNSIYHWKYDEPRSTSLKKVAKALDVSTDYLLDTKEKDLQTNIVDLDDLSSIMMFEGKPIPEEDKETVINVLRNLRKAREEINRKKNDK